MPGRNEKCPCGSGKKFKACCGQIGRAASAPATPSADPGRLKALLDAGRYADLEHDVRALLLLSPDSGELWALLGTALSRQGKDAREAWGKSVEHSPLDAIAQHNLGNAFARAGRHLQAAACYRRALDLAPGFAPAHNNLASSLLQLGRCDDAIAGCRRALELEPDYAEAHNTLGCALLKLAQSDAAIASFRRALAVSPDFVEAQVHLASARRSIGQLEEAEAGYRRALALDPQLIAAHTGLATVQRLQRRTEASAASCEKALAIDPGSAEALAVMAELKSDAGLFSEAEALLRRVIAIEPDSVPAWAALAQLRSMTSADENWLIEARRLADSGQPPHRELLRRYAIGKYYDDLKLYDQAFRSYERANELARARGPAHDRVALSRGVDLIVQTFDRRWIKQMRGAGNASARPVFIVGMLRSGTSLAEQILASHPSVLGAGELSFWRTAWTGLCALERPAPTSAAGPDAATLARLAQDYLGLLDRLSADAARVVDKMPTNFLLLGLIHASLPQARIIHLQRNARDTCLSIYFQHFEAANTYANDLGDLAHYTAQYRRLLQHWRESLPQDVMLEVPYEQLVADPQAWSRKMLAFIGLPWDPHCLEPHRTARTVVTASRWQVRQKIHRASDGRWRHYEKYLAPLQELAES